MIALLSNSNFCPWNKRFLTRKKNWKMCPWKIRGRESEKHGKKWTWNHFFARKETSKRGQKMVSRAVLLFKGEETGCILIRSLHLKINFPNRQNKKCSKVKRSIQKKKMRETFRKKSWEIKKKTWILGLKMTQSDPSVSQYILEG